MTRVFRNLICCLLFANITFAREVFVDNLIGRDSHDGLVATIAPGFTGPVRTFARAVQVAKFGDVIVVANNGIPYYDSISLTGSQHSGTPLRPFTIQGNGATISGLRTVPKEGWQEVSPKVWKLALTRKGYYQLLRDGRLLPEFRPDNTLNPLELVPAGHWVAWKGSLYFRQDGVDTPDVQNFTYAADQTGVSLHSVSNVLLLNLKLEHFRVDGLHAQGMCDHVELVNVSSVENGRGGIASTGKSDVHIYGGEIARNGRHQILTKDRSTATLHNDVTNAPTDNSIDPQHDDNVPQ